MVVGTCHPLNDVKGLMVLGQIQRHKCDGIFAGYQVLAMGLAVPLEGLFTEEIEVVEHTKTMSGAMNAEFTQCLPPALPVQKSPFIRGLFACASAGLNRG